jgi:hypothetical protein
VTKDVNNALQLMLTAANLNDSYSIAMYGKMVYNYRAKARYSQALDLLGKCMIKMQEPYCSHIVSYYIEEAAQTTTNIVQAEGGQYMHIGHHSEEMIATQVQKIASDVAKNYS